PANPTVIVLHGGPGGDYRNLRALEALADDYFVVFYDQRGTGLSPRVPSAELTFDGSIDDLHRVVLHYGGGSPVALIGHSWGGMMAAYYATRRPEFVARAALAEPGVLTDAELAEFMDLMRPKLSPGLLWYLAGALLQSLRVRGPDRDASRDYLVERMMHAPGEGNALNRYWCDGQAPAAASEMWRVGARAMQAIQAETRKPDGGVRMPPLDPSAYTGELLFIASRCNTLIGVERQRSHAAMFPSARVAIIEDAGHLMFTDQPEASLDVLRRYLGAWPRG
ncbi:MAG: alpha/beta fold hydrolase, partial [Myxococcales bacterium]|nr:alpha/beta fold hydrolase [Myxococcales bacterium]